MFHDLNVCAHPSTELLQTLVNLGYKKVAISTVVTSKSSTPPSLPSHPGLTLFARASIILSETSQLPLLTAPNLSSFDLVSVLPTTEKLLQAALNADVDIISLPLEKRAMYRLRRAHVHVAQAKGIRFEIPYTQALHDSRRNFFANAAGVVRVTNGKQLLITSGARSHMVSWILCIVLMSSLTVKELRGAHDVINLVGLFDIPVQCARNALGESAAEIVKRGDVRARCCKGIVRVVDEGDKMEE